MEAHPSHRSNLREVIDNARKNVHPLTPEQWNKINNMNFDRSYIEPPEIDETDWEWDQESRKWYLKDSRETPPEQDR